MSKGILCTAGGQSLCIHVPDPIHIGQQVVTGEHPGRTIHWTGGGVGTRGSLIINAASPIGVLGVITNSYNVKVKDLDAFGTQWTKHRSPQGWYYVSVRYPARYLTSLNCRGCILVAAPHPYPHGGGYQQWLGPA